MATKKKHVQTVSQRAATKDRAAKFAARDPETLAAEAIELSIASITPAETAKRFGVSIKQARILLAKALAEISTPRNTEYERGLAILRVDTLLKALWPAATRKEEDGKPPCLYSVDRIIKLLERQARYLGLDEPLKTAHTVAEGGSAGLTKEVANFFKADILGITEPVEKTPGKGTKKK